MAELLNNILSDFPIIHTIGDLNIDHQRTSEAVTIACRPIENSFVETIYHFETLSSTEMAGYVSGRAFLPNVFVNITDHISKIVFQHNTVSASGSSCLDCRENKLEISGGIF